MFVREAHRALLERLPIEGQLYVEGPDRLIDQSNALIRSLDD